jgi:hypothetical protein
MRLTTWAKLLSRTSASVNPRSLFVLNFSGMGKQERHRNVPFLLAKLFDKIYTLSVLYLVMLRIIINKNMKHFIYKTTHTNGKYYIGRHSTENINDGYIGSGLWPSSIKDKSTLTREILEYANSVEQVKELEGQYLAEHYGKPGCMNRTADPIGFDTDNNPMKDPTIVAKISGDNHWFNKDPVKHREKFAGDAHWMNRNPEARQIFLDNHPNKDGRNAKTAMANGTHINITNNPSIWRSDAGIHHWQNGKSPNAGGKLNKKLIEAGTHNLLGPSHNLKRVEAGTHNFVGSDSNLKRLVEGTHPSQMKKTCEHCGKVASVSMYTRWHGNNCRNR